MKQLEKTLTSLEVAEMVGREHKNVLQDVRGIIAHLGELKIQPSSYFIESTYLNSQNKKMPRFLLTKQGCELYGNRMTGIDGTAFSIKYIERFNEMEHHFEQQQLPRDPIELALETSLKNYQEIKTIKGDVDLLKNSMRIDGAQEFALNSQGKAKVLEVLGGYESPAYNAISKKVFAKLWRDFKKYFKLPRYSELPKSKFNEAVYFISKWRPETAMEIEVENINRQGHLKIAE